MSYSFSTFAVSLLLSPLTREKLILISQPKFLRILLRRPQFEDTGPAAPCHHIRTLAGRKADESHARFVQATKSSTMGEPESPFLGSNLTFLAKPSASKAMHFLTGDQEYKKLLILGAAGREAAEDETCIVLCGGGRSIQHRACAFKVHPVYDKPNVLVGSGKSLILF